MGRVRIYETAQGNLMYDITGYGKRSRKAVGIKTSQLPSGKKAREEYLNTLIRDKKQELDAIFTGNETMIKYTTRNKARKVSLLAYASQDSIRKTDMGRERYNVKGLLRLLDEFKGSDISIIMVDATWCKSFKRFILDKGYKQGTAHLYWSALSFVMGQAVKEGLIFTNPCSRINGIKADTSEDLGKKPLSLEEVKLLEAHSLTSLVGAEVCRTFLFGCYTGLRVSDLKTLTWGDIKFDKTTYKPSYIEKMMVKTHHKVIVPLFDEAIKIIGTDPFHKNDEKAFNLNQYAGESHFKIWVKRAGLDIKLSWHNARKTCATYLETKGIDGLEIQRILGHKKIIMTSKYAKLTLKKLESIKAQVNAALQEDISRLDTQQAPASNDTQPSMRSKVP